MEKVVYQDLYQFNFLSDPVVAPDGAHAIFTRHNAVEESNSYTSEIWIIDLATQKYHPLTTGGKERGGFWIDSDNVAFVANREDVRGGKDAKGKKTAGTTWYKINIHGGEAQPWLTTPERAGQIKLIDEDTYVYTVNRSAENSAVSCAKEETPKAEEGISSSSCGHFAEHEMAGANNETLRAKEGEDFFIFDEFPFWFNGRRVINKKRNAIVIHQDGADKTITPRYLDVIGLQLSPDKTKIVYGGSEYTDVLTRASGMYLYDIVTGETRTLIPQADLSVGSFYFMGDNEIFYTGLADEKRGGNADYYIYDLNAGESKKLPFPDASPRGGIGTDASMGGGNGMKYVNGYLYFCQTVWGDVHMVRMDHVGNLEKVNTTPGSINAFDMAGDTVIFTAMRGNNLVELYRLKDGKEERLTALNQPYMQSHSVITPEYFTFENRAGVTLEGYVLRPLGFEPGKKYPGILEMHGGPKVAFGSIFHHEMQCFANMGYFVFFTNPRGSDGRGDEFARINGLLGTIDYDDFMDFTDEMIRRYPELDAEHIGICGGSYGGYMCNWMIGQTDRYAAAASQRSISNYFTKLLCTDIGITYDLPQAGGDPWNDFDKVWEISPLKYAPRAKTPTLFIQSDEDYRCWMSGAIQMFNALQQNGVPSRIALFHGETHELSRSGKPHNRISRLTEIGDWFEKYLKA